MLTAALILLFPQPAPATSGPPDCEAKAAAAGREAGIPDGILPAIARVESARKGRAWAWTLNQGGDGSYHQTKAEALERLEQILATGETNVDLGCMQLNWRWHGDQFPDAATMLDPDANTRYAARYLVSLKESHGDWDSAVSAYHSKKPERGAAYGEKVATARALILAEQSSGTGPQADLPMPASAPSADVPAAQVGLLAWSGQPLVAKTGDAGGLLGARGLSILSAGN